MGDMTDRTLLAALIIAAVGSAAACDTDTPTSPRRDCIFDSSGQCVDPETGLTESERSGGNGSGNGNRSGGGGSSDGGDRDCVRETSNIVEQDINDNWRFVVHFASSCRTTAYTIALSASIFDSRGIRRGTRLSYQTIISPGRPAVITSWFEDSGWMTNPRIRWRWRTCSGIPRTSCQHPDPPS